MALKAAVCENCGGNLSVDDAREVGYCPYCGTKYYTEKIVNNNYVTNNYNGATIIQNQAVSVDNYIKLAEQYCQDGELDKAKDTVEKALPLEPENAYLWKCMLDIVAAESFGVINNKDNNKKEILEKWNSYFKKEHEFITSIADYRNSPIKQKEDEFNKADSHFRALISVDILPKKKGINHIKKILLEAKISVELSTVDGTDTRLIKQMDNVFKKILSFAKDDDQLINDAIIKYIDTSYMLVVHYANNIQMYSEDFYDQLARVIDDLLSISPEDEYLLVSKYEVDSLRILSDMKYSKELSNWESVCMELWDKCQETVSYINDNVELLNETYRRYVDSIYEIFIKSRTSAFNSDKNEIEITVFRKYLMGTIINSDIPGEAFNGIWCELYDTGKYCNDFHYNIFYRTPLLEINFFGKADERGRVPALWEAQIPINGKTKKACYLQSSIIRYFEKNHVGYESAEFKRIKDLFWGLEKKERGCYIATCAYGSYDCPQVWTLRRYRDNTLAKNWFGRCFIKSYYAISPTVVKYFGNYNLLKKMWKSILDRVVKSLNEKGVSDKPYVDV